MKKTLSWLMVLLMVFGPFAGTVINASAEVPNQDNAVIASEEQDGTQSETEQSPVDTISTTMTSDTIPAPEPTDPPYEVVVVHSEGGHFTGGKENYPTLNVTLQKGRKLPNDLSYWEPVRPGYRFDGWYAKQDGGADDAKYKGGETVPEGVTDFYACWVRVVVLDAEPGNFTSDTREEGSWNYTRTVDIVDGTFPEVKETPVYDIAEKDDQTVEFVGWFTEKCTITRTQCENEEGTYWTWSIQNNGKQIQAGEKVSEDITTLYAGYKLKEGTSPRKSITYYYDWNGINGMWGHCLTSSRAYNESEKGYKLTAGDLLICYLNWDGDDVSMITTQDALSNYWKDKKFDGYTFLGWATTPDAEEPDVSVDSLVKNGDSLYAVWTKEGKSNKDFDRSEPPVGPLTAMRFLNLKISTHGVKEASLTVALFTTPVDAELKDLTWTITYGVPNENNVLAPPITRTGTVKYDQPFEKDGIRATAEGRQLTIVDMDGQEHGITVSATAVSTDNVTVSTPADATVSFTHKWEVKEDGEHEEPTCTKKGYETCKCSDCDATKKKVIPPLEHLWEFQITKRPTCTETGIKQLKCTRPGCETTFEEYQEWLNSRGMSEKPAREPEIIPALGHEYAVVETSTDEHGMRCFTEECSSCETTESGQYGDVNKDGEVSLVDLVQMYQFVNDQIDALPQEVAGDIDGSNEVTEGDAEQLYQYISGQTPSL